MTSGQRAAPTGARRTNRCGPCAKKEVSRRVPIPLRMGGHRARVGSPAIAAIAIVALLLGTLGPGAGRAAPVHSGPAVVPATPAHTWSNGFVRLTFPTNGPSFVVASLADPRISSTHPLGGVAEVTPSGSTVLFAPFPGNKTTWSFSTQGYAGGVAIQASARVPVMTANGSWEAGDDIGEDGGGSGNASVNVTYYLNDTSDPATVRFGVNVSGWPWLDPTNDSLGLEISMVAANATSIVPGNSSYAIQEIANGSRASVASLRWSPSASVHYGNGSSSTSAVGTYPSYGAGGRNSTIRLVFASVAGGYRNLSYDPWVALNLRAFAGGPLPAWVITDVTWASIAGAAAVGLWLGIGGVRRRRHPSEEPL